MGARTVVRALVQLALLPLLIHRLGAEPTGLFIFATTLTGYFTIAEAGLGTSVTKYVAEHRATGDAEQLGSVLRASLLLMVAIGIVAAVAIALLGILAGSALFGDQSTDSQVVPTLLVTAATMLFYWPSRLGVAALQGLERYDLTGGIQMVLSLLMLGLIYVVTEVSGSVPLLVLIFNAMLVLEGAGAAALALPHLGLRRGVGRWRGAHMRPVFRFGGGLAVMGLADTFVYDSDRLVLAAFVGAAAITVYQVAVTLQNAVRQANGLIGGALISPFSRLAAQGRTTRLHELVLVGSFYSIVLTLPLVILLLVLAEPIIEVWVGPAYGHYAVYAQIFVSYWFFQVNTGAISAAVTGIGRIRTFVWITTIGALITLALSIGLVVAWGAVGVIWGTVIPSLLGLPIWMHYALGQIGISKLRYTREVLVSAYLPIVLWSIPVVVLALVLAPHGVLELAMFCGLALAVLWIALLPRLRTRWRRALSETSSSAAVLA